MKDNVVLRFLNKITDLVVLNLLFIVCSLPIFTIGASLTAMFSVSLRSVRYGDGYVIKKFFQSFRASFKQATLAWLINFAFLLMIFVDLQFWSKVAVQSMLTKGMLVLSVGVGIFISMIFLWVYPVIAKMKGTLKEQFKNAAAMAIGYFFPYTFLCLIVIGMVAVMAYTNIGFVLIMLVVGFATVSYVLSFFFYKVFANHIEEEALDEDDPLYGSRQTH